MKIDDTRPIWIQLSEEFTRRIVSGEWAIGSKIPSVRDLALEAGVNPNTVQRALGAIDARGLTTTERTAGRFVTREEEAITAARNELAVGATDTFITAITAIGLEQAEVLALLSTRWDDTADTGGAQ
ncbi:GntR family transcriptional regulator [Schaalia sp. ZJ405]|uniref:GntR family transcriptional regulator n=1 Tax=unclassified Schaalia TaxID=2691889 RepID=UPI0013EB5892|nr:MULTISPECIES: GntR family transcriptional regulator [unclassified Schaalia]QPK80852.1 GntR family transcriptional regulator [Schaalia sp. ZJ405]